MSPKRLGAFGRFMAALIACSVVVAALGRRVSADEVIFSYPMGQRVAVRITQDALDRAPRWRNLEPNPPVAAREAILRADQQKSRLVKERSGFIWRLESASLVPCGNDRWYWLVSFVEESNGGIVGMPPFLRVAVLMDGSVAEATVRPWNRDDRSSGASASADEGREGTGRGKER
jgi:hypothetical protein